MEDTGKWNQWQLEWDQYIQCTPKKGTSECWIAEDNGERTIQRLGSFPVVKCGSGCHSSFNADENVLLFKKDDTPRTHDKKVLYCTARGHGEIIEDENEKPEIMECNVVKK